MSNEMADLREKLVWAEARIVEFNVANVSLNTTQNEAIASRISKQEELNFYKSDGYKKNILDEFKSSAKYNEKIGREAGSFLDKGCVYIIRQLHPYFEDKVILLRAFEANFDNKVCRQGTDFVPFIAEEIDALWKREEKRGMHV